VAVYTGDRLPELGLDRALGNREVRYWTEKRHGGGASVLVMWERPTSPAAWEALAAGVTGAIYLLWEPQQVEPEASLEWLTAFHRELAARQDLPVHAIKSWAATLGPLMRETGFAMLAELGVLTLEEESWSLAPWPEGVEIEALVAWQAYQAARTFRLLLANGKKAEVLKALRHRQRLGATVG
jgi:hypothetical protein